MVGNEATNIINYESACFFGTCDGHGSHGAPTQEKMLFWVYVAGRTSYKDFKMPIRTKYADLAHGNIKLNWLKSKTSQSIAEPQCPL